MILHGFFLHVFLVFTNHPHTTKTQIKQIIQEELQYLYEDEEEPMTDEHLRYESIKEIGGILYNPYIFSQAVSPRGEIIESTKSRVKSRLPISAETLDQIQEAMVAVVNVGTGKRASLPYAQVGGKTGTAENSTELNHSWFIGYAPISFPRIAIAAILENSPSGSVVPVVQKVMDAYLNPIPVNQKGTGFKETQIADQE